MENKCLYCWKPIVNEVIREIIQRDNRARNGLKKTMIKFCSEQCATHYQMGCEG